MSNIRVCICKNVYIYTYFKCDRICEKGVLYTHPIFSNFKEVQLSFCWTYSFEILVAVHSYHCTNSTENFSLIACLQMKLCLIKVGKLDECIRPLFANSVTYVLVV